MPCDAKHRRRTLSTATPYSPGHHVPCPFPTVHGLNVPFQARKAQLLTYYGAKVHISDDLMRCLAGPNGSVYGPDAPR